MASGRNALELYDANYARKQTMLAEPHKYTSAGPSAGRGPQPIPMSAEIQAKIARALAKEGQKLREREVCATGFPPIAVLWTQLILASMPLSQEERRKRDPSYRPDAIELSSANLLEFDKYTDYYAILKIDQFASANEIKSAFKKQSLELHPDKQKGKNDEQRAKAKELFLEMTAAHKVLSDLATRRAYDHARDNLDARNESGLIDAGKFDKPPPTCVDVVVTLEQLYRGTRKSMEFERNEFAGTRWAKKSHDSFGVKINRGEYEGATIWFKSQGDVGPFGRADLVFIVKQAAHPVFERLGDDLWYYDTTPTPAGDLFYVGWAPTLAQTPMSELRHASHRGYRQVAAVGNTLAALLGFDRSGLGEALVPGHGMPLRDGAPESAANRTRGELVVKFNITLPAVTPRVRLAYGDGALPMPPIALVTPDATTGSVPPAASLLITGTILPAVVHKVHRATLAHRARRRAKPPSYPPTPPGEEAPPETLSPSAMPPCHYEPPWPTELTAVCLLVGGGATSGADAQPSDAARGLMAMLSASMPTLVWTTIRMSAFVSEPLLTDECIAIEHAAVVILEAILDTPDAGGIASTHATASPTFVAASAVGGNGTALTAATHPWSAATEWRVDFTPGVRVRSAARHDAPIVGVMRSGSTLDGLLVGSWREARGSTREAMVGSWLKIDTNGGMERYAQCPPLLTSLGHVACPPHSTSLGAAWQVRPVRGFWWRDLLAAT